MLTQRGLKTFGAKDILPGTDVYIFLNVAIPPV
jgi:hypothetical protein